MMNIPQNIFLNGNIITVTAGRKEAMAICGKRIAKVGKNNQIKKLAGNKTQVFDLKGKTVVPGFIDAHTHFIRMGLEKAFYLDLSPAGSLSEALEIVSEQVKRKPDGEWIIGRGWDESRWPENRYITRDDLDKIALNNPVVLIREDGHIFSVNSNVLERIKFANSDEVDKTAGLIREKAAWKLYQQIEPSPEIICQAIREATKIAHSLGVTSIQDTVKPAYIRAYSKLNQRKELKIRVYLNLAAQWVKTFVSTGFCTGFGDDFLKIGGVKILADGSIGARNAALQNPYLNQNSKGKLNYRQVKLENMIREATTNNLQTAIHAIGDRAIESVLDAYTHEKIKKAERHRIEHFILATDRQISKAGNLQIIASMQPNFLKWGKEGGLYERRLGKERARRTNRFKKVLDAGIKLAFGSDCMPFSPLYGIHQVVNAPFESQRLSVKEAIKCYTLNSAYASFEEDTRGSIEPGKLADLVILSEDPFANPKNIEEIKVEQTFMGGKRVYPP